MVGFNIYIYIYIYIYISLILEAWHSQRSTRHDEGTAAGDDTAAAAGAAVICRSE